MESLEPEQARFRSGHTQSNYLHFVVLFNLSAFFYFAHVFTLFSCFAAALSIHHLVFFVATFFHSFIQLVVLTALAIGTMAAALRAAGWAR